MRIFIQKKCWRPTWLGWLIIAIFILVGGRLFLSYSVHFLSVNHPVKAKTLVVEGWVETYVMIDALDYYRKNGFERMIVTGIPITIYEFIAPYKNTAEASVFTLQYYGFTDTIYRANIPTNIFTDRTYSTGLMVKSVFDAHPQWEKSVDIYSVGVHSRRSLYLFEMALGKEFEVGIVAHPDRSFQAETWWRSSKGFRNVTNEMLATPYAMLFFHPDRQQVENTIVEGLLLDEIVDSRQEKNHEFADSTTSPFTRDERDHFKGFNYFVPDLNYRVKADIKVDTTHPPFELATNTTRRPVYREYGKLSFYVNDTLCELTAFQNMEHRNHPEYGKLLFVPFRDRTCSSQSYEAGRYLDIPIPDSSQLWLDFNLAYNPYCAYADRWSCPLVPMENQLPVAIPAGEKKYIH
jgi:uncharacterized protein (DUF1684 family)